VRKPWTTRTASLTVVSPPAAPGPGRPRRAIEADYLRSISDPIPPEEWKAIVSKAREQALAGDHTARRWLADYLLGPPAADRLLNLPAAELAGFDAVRDKAVELSRLVNPFSWLDRNADGQAAADG
jgi:hypothetical protein